VENDPLTRIVQECVTRADYRWQMRALMAFDRREPWPEQLTESSVLQQCMDDSARGLLGEAKVLKEKNAALEQRLAEMVKEHLALQQKTEEERKELVRRSDEERKDLFKRGDEQRRELLALQSKLGEHLGAAAKKIQPLPPPSPAIATATATSEGRSRTEGGPEAQPATLAVITPPAAPAGGPVTATATLGPGGSVPPACVVQPERAAKAEPPKKKATPSRQARSPSRSAEPRKKAVAISDLPACDPAKTPQAVTAAQASVPTSKEKAAAPAAAAAP
jgi:hypothetical protein